MEIKKLYMNINLQSCYLGGWGLFGAFFFFFWLFLLGRKNCYESRKIRIFLPSCFFMNNLFSISVSVLPDSVIAALGAWKESKNKKKKKKAVGIQCCGDTMQRTSNTASTKSFHLISTYRKVKGQISYWNMSNLLMFMMETRQAGHLVTFQMFTVGKLPRPASY